MKSRNGKVVGFELSSQDPEKAAAFYSKVFGWNLAEPQWDFWTVSTGHGDGLSGGISKGPHDHPHGTRIQIEVDSIEETISAAKDYGAMVVRDKMEFDYFFLAYLVDPTGVGIGLIEKK
ncbi:VOC family protein [Rossellomorea aquimaris]|nr:VOC family protein [Rossellomorea aquimaris]WRP04538.1 VOC family protein [Rossellomorea aquimaris]